MPRAFQAGGVGVVSGRFASADLTGLHVLCFTFESIEQIMNSTLDLALAMLKLAAVLATGILGVTGLLVDYKDADKKITKWGRRSLIGIIATTLIAVATQGVETYKQRQSDQKDKDAAVARYAEVQTTLLEIRRAMYPIKDVQVDARADVSMTVKQVAMYMNRVNRVRSDLVKSQGGFDNNSNIDLPEKLWPNPSRELVARRILNGFGVELGFFRRPVENISDVLHDLYHKADLFIDATPVDTTHQYLSLIEDPTMLRVSAYNMTASSAQIRFNTGAIASVYDLFGAQAYVGFRYDDSDDNIDGVAEAQQKSILDLIRIRINGVEIDLEKCKPVGADAQVCSLSDAHNFRGIDLSSFRPTVLK